MTVIDLIVSEDAHGGGRYLARAWETGGYHSVGNHFSSGTNYPNYTFSYFELGAILPSSSIVSSAHYSVTRYFGAGQPKTSVRAEISSNPAPPASDSDHLSRTRTTAGVQWDFAFPSPEPRVMSPSILSIINEIKSLSPSTVLILHDNGGSATGSANRVSYDATNQGSQYGPGLHIEYIVPNTAPEITVAPTVSYGSLTRLGPNNTPATVSFEAEDPEETGVGELTAEIRTAASGAGTLVATQNVTSGVPFQMNVAHNASGLSEGSNNLYLRVGDGTEWSDDAPFTVLVDRTAPTVGTIISTPSPVTGGG